MDSMYSSASGSSKATSGSVFDSLDEILDEGESGCPAFERLIQRAENENSELVRLLEEEARKQKALQKELEDTNSQKEILERSSRSLKEEEKQLQRLANQNKEISESLKRTNALLQQHEGTLQKKYEKACFDLQKLQLDNTEVVDKYKGTWDRYYAFYEKSKLAVDLANTKRTALEKQKQASDIEEKIKDVEVQLMNAEKEKKNIEEKLRNGPKSSRASMIKFYDSSMKGYIRAELYIQASNAIKLGNEKVDQVKKKQRKEENLEHAMVTSASADPGEQQLECERENTDQGIQRKEHPRVINEAPAQENSSHQQQHTIVNIDPENPPPPHHVHSHGRNQENSRNIVQPMQKDSSPKQDSFAKEGPFQIKSPAFQMSSQKNFLIRPMDSPRPTAITTKGLTNNHGRFLSSYSPINTTYTFQTSLSPARAHQYQLFNGSSKTPCTSQQTQNWMKDSFSTTNNEGQVINKTTAEQPQLTPQECQEQMVQDIPSVSHTTAKSPRHNISTFSPKTPNTEPDGSDAFNFTDYSERVKLMNKSPGEGFSYRSRPMFDVVENMNEDNNRYEHIPNQSFFQPFFATRENEPHEQFADKPTFFTMSPQSNQENTVQQGHQFQLERDHSSSPNSNNLFSSTPGEECATSPAVGFSLFSDQPAANPGRHGNQSPQSPGFAFNFCNSPSLPTDNSTNNTGTFNLF